MNTRILERACLGGGIVLLALGAANPGRAEIIQIDRDGLKIDSSVSICPFCAETDVRTLQFVQRARRLGFSVKEVARLLALWRDKTRVSSEMNALPSGM